MMKKYILVSTRLLATASITSVHTQQNMGDEFNMQMEKMRGMMPNTGGKGRMMESKGTMSKIQSDRQGMGMMFGSEVEKVISRVEVTEIDMLRGFNTHKQ